MFIMRCDRYIRWMENIQLLCITIRYKSSDPKQGHLQIIVDQSRHDAYITRDYSDSRCVGVAD